jgi:hypothetical protein
MKPLLLPSNGLSPSMRPPRTQKTSWFGGLSFETFASNLRVLDMGTAETVRPVAIWGPASHDPFPDYLERVRDVLDAAC